MFQEPLAYRPMAQPGIRDEIDLTMRELSHSASATQQEVLDALQHYGYKAMMTDTVGRKLRETELKKLSELFEFNAAALPVPE